MTDTLIVLLSADGRAVLAWSAFDHAGQVVAHDGSGIAPAPASRRTIAIAPGTDVLSRRIDVPRGSGARARAALAYVLEDDLAGPVETVHVARGPTDASGQAVAAAVSRATLARWLETLTAAALVADAVVPDFVVPAAGSEPVAVSIGGRVVVALPDGTGFAAEDSWIDHVLPAAESGQPVRPAVMDAREFLNLAWARVRERAAPNLLQGEFAPASSAWLDGVAWRRTAVLAASLAVLFVVQQSVSAFQDRRAAAAAYAEAEAAARTALPADARLVNARAQIKARREALAARADDAFLAVSEALAAALAGSPGLSIDSLRFDAGRGAVTAVVAAADYAALDALKARLGQDGLAVEDGEARQAGATVLGEFSLSRR
ncbi:MAG: type II secretion system protein GspL [Rhodospirillaceae bacterium]|nr:type II secretion system protein GspL [Rhodospirillaceae bacterium]